MQEDIHPLIISSISKRSKPEISKVLNFIEEKRSLCEQRVNFINFEEMSRWSVNELTGEIQHESKKFFSIKGLDVFYEKGLVQRWQQPIICQPEIGILGIICKKINNILHFLLQLKAEPGNIGNLQLSPTLQATRSNFNKVHKGKVPEFLDFFKNSFKSKIIVNVLQSEQGSRFLKKQNQNIIIETDSDIDPRDNFIWLTLGQIFELMKHDNIVNMDTRTVLACIPFHDINNCNTKHFQSILNSSNELCPIRFEIGKSLLENHEPLHSNIEIISWFTDQKIKHQMITKEIPLNKVENWHHNETELTHAEKKFFIVKACRVHSPGREVPAWDQPIIQPRHEGLIVLFIKKICGIYHFLIQAKAEPGIISHVEIATTIQCITGNLKNSPKDKWPKFVDYFASQKDYKVIYDTMQSEEGGRFYKESNRNVIIEVDEHFTVEEYGSHIWVTLAQLKSFIQFNNFVNIQCRSLISCLGLF